MRVLFLLCLLPLALARDQYLQLIPNGDAWDRPNSGITCRFLGHQDCVEGAERNPFGLAFAANNRKWTKALCEEDSDGDGLTNGEELGDPCCEWSVDQPIAVREDQLSHPGDAKEDGAKDAPGCTQGEAPPASETPPVASPTSTTEVAPVTEPTPTSEAPPELPSETESSPTPVPPQNEEEGENTVQPTAAGTPELVSGDPEPSNNDDDGVCFPAHATVALQSGEVKQMRHLQIGDTVQVGADQYSDIFMFTHKMKDVLHEFVTIQLGATSQRVEASLTLTRGHYLYVNGKLATAGSVVVGDELELVSGERKGVIDVSCALHKGLFNPQTTHGDLIVDNVRVSTYTTAVETSLAHSLLAPLRMIYRVAGWTTSAFENGSDRAVALLRN